jgi:hypothetical protein
VALLLETIQVGYYSEELSLLVGSLPRQVPG